MYNIIIDFSQVKTVSDVPSMMCLLDERPSGKLCLAYPKQSAVDALDEITMQTQRLHTFDSVKVLHKKFFKSHILLLLIRVE